MCQVYAESREGPKSDQIMMWLFTTLVQSKCGWTTLEHCHLDAAQGTYSKSGFFEEKPRRDRPLSYTSLLLGVPSTGWRTRTEP